MTTRHAWQVALVRAPDSTEAEDPGYRIDPARIVDLLPRLCSVEQQVIDMYIFQGLDQRAIAERLGVSQPAVSCRLRHAYALLRHWATLPPYDPEEVRSQILAKRPGAHTDVWLAVLDGYARGMSVRQIASLLNKTQADVWTIAFKLRHDVPMSRAYLKKPPWPCGVLRSAKLARLAKH